MAMTLEVQHRHRYRQELTLLAAEPTTAKIQARHMKHIAEISKHLATEPIQSEEPTFERRRMVHLEWRDHFPNHTERENQ